MTDIEIIPEEEAETEEEAELEGLWLDDGGVHIYDMHAFFELTKAVAVRNIEGHIEVMDAETFKWQTPDKAVKPIKTTLSAVK